jgi:hypothetical protein
MIMKGSGCKNCPVNPCETMNYRGSTCAAQRAKFGLGDPQTNADRIRAMSDVELAKWIDNFFWGHKKVNLFDILKWLQQPAEEVSERES